jgi:hypothetical protein
VKIPQLAHAVAAVFILGIISPLATLADTSPAMAQQMAPEKPGGTGSPDGCVPLGVTKSPSGVVYAVEKCNGEIYHRRMN